MRQIETHGHPHIVTAIWGSAVCTGRTKALVVVLMTLVGSAVHAAPAARTPAKKGKATVPIKRRPVAKKAQRPSPATVELMSGKREDEAPPPSPTDPDRERILRVQEALHGLVHGPVLGRARTAIRVIEARSGRVLYARGADALMDPASNQKILATAASLYRLGNQFRYRTEVRGAMPDEEGEIKGDLILRGSGDPALTATHLDELANQLFLQGVRRISGDVVADRRYLGADELPRGSPLVVSRSAIVVRVRPGDRAKAQPLVIYEPAADGIVVFNRATTVAKGRTRISVTVTTQGGRIVINVGGRISLRHAGVVFRRRPSAPLLYAAALLSQSLSRRGVQIGGAPLVRDVGPSDESTASAKFVLAHHQSAALPELLRPINKNSNNEYADRLLETLGSQMYGGAPSMDKGLRALRATLGELGVPPEGYHATNGSGLGHRNRLTADGLTNLLRTLYFDPRVGPELVSSLSVGGVDGTTKHRFTGTSAAHRVRAKTGTLNGKSCLSGYVGDESEILIFSIMVDRVGRSRVNAVRKAQVLVVDTLMGYAKGLVGDTEAEHPDPGIDFEQGEDVIEGEDVLGPSQPAAPSDEDAADDEPATRGAADGV